MPRPDEVEPTLDEYGHETHPAFATIGVTRGSVSPPGASLFDSEILHQNVMTLRISTATRKRDLHRDWVHSDKVLVEVAMSEAQWASFVSSVGLGNGVSCTLSYTKEDGLLPGLPYSPRMQQQVDETRNAAVAAYAKVMEAFAKVQEKPTKGNLRDLEIALSHVGPNVAFATKMLAEHVETTVQKARADIEAMVAQHAATLGIEAPSYTAPLEITGGDDEQE